MSSFDESTIVRDGNGQFGQKAQSAPEVALASASRGADLAAADALEDALNEDNRYGAMSKDAVVGIRTRITELRARPDRVKEPLSRLSLQPYNRSIHSFMPREVDDYEFDPPYQRGAVWSEPQQRALFESMMRGLPIGSILLNDRLSASRDLPADAPAYAVVDGKQRIQAIRAFANDELALPADWFEDTDIRETSDEQTVTFSQLTLRGQRGIQNLPVPTIQASVGTVEEEARLFNLVNFGGTAQTHEDRTRAEKVAGQGAHQ